MQTNLLSPREVKGFLKVADILTCGDNEFPKFSSTDFYKKVDYILEELPQEDFEGIKFLFNIFSYLPSFFITFIIFLTENPFGPSFIKSQFLKINSGLKGIVFTIYYSRLPGEGERIFSLLGWQTKIPGYLGENRFNELN
jgi:hypothetical protein